MGNEITIRVCGTNGWNFNKRSQLFGEEYFPVVRAKGMDIYPVEDTRQFNLTEGVIWAEMVNRFSVTPFLMDDGDTFTGWYLEDVLDHTDKTFATIVSTYGSGIPGFEYNTVEASDGKYYRYKNQDPTTQDWVDGWLEVENYKNVEGWARVYQQTQVDNLLYNDRSTTKSLTELADDQFGIAWVYEVHDNSVHVVYGRGSYNSTQAGEAPLPSPIPGLLASYATLVGKIIIQKGASDLAAVETPFVTRFSTSGVQLHNDLNGTQGGEAGNYYHLGLADYNKVRNITRSYNNIELTALGWALGDDSLYEQSVTLTGLTFDYDAFVALNYSELAPGSWQLLENEYSLIKDAEITTDTITFKAESIPLANLAVNIKAVK
jgi:hypothetical protein